MTEKTNLNELIRKIQEDKILLPDFQRGFVWTDEERQKKLVASVLTKMPLGSILLLKSNKKDYGYKVIGRTTKKDAEKMEAENVEVLLDGQQRLTVLTNIFSNIIFCDLKDYVNELASPSLKRRFFIKIPLYKDMVDSNVEDHFGIRKLAFPLENPETEYPKFLTKDIADYIEVFSFKKEDGKAYNPKTSDVSRLIAFCTGQDCYYIPLYLLVGDKKGDTNQESNLNMILKDIVSKVVFSIMDEYDLLESETQKEEFVTAHVEYQYVERVREENIRYQKGYDERGIIQAALEEQGRYLWQQRVLSYLKSCIQQMDLHQIVVEESDRDRAIDIYENLNLGGVTLSTFDLILAKAAASKKIEYENNLYDKIVEHILKSKKYNEQVLPYYLEERFPQFLKREGEYSASKRMKCYIEGKNKKEVNKKYTDAFLNVLSLLVNRPDYNVSANDLELIKRTRILKLQADQINEKWESVCKGLDRACYFFQTRCGLRTINELSYNLMFVLVGYLFTNDVFYNDKQVHKRLEGWYWSSIFSGHYTKDQNRNMIKDLSGFLVALRNKTAENAFSFLLERKKLVFNMPNFSDMSALLLEDGQEARSVIKNCIAQFYLAKTYKDMLKGEKGYKNIDIFMEDVDKLEMHHIMPIGDKTMNYKEGTKRKRGDKKEILNSPMNFVYVTSETNKRISSNTIESYLNKCNDYSLFKLQLKKDWSVKEPEQVKEILKERAELVITEIKSVIEDLLGGD